MRATLVGRGTRPLIAAIAAAVAILMSVVACGGGSGHGQNPDKRDSYATLVGAGAKLLGMGNLNAAEQLFQQAASKKPHDPVAYYDLGVVYQQEGLRRPAVRSYFHAIAENRYYAPALYNQAVLLAKRNAPLAEFYYRRIIALKPDSATAYLNLGLLEWVQKPARKLALRDLAHAVKLDPSLRAQIPPSVRIQLPTGSE